MLGRLLLASICKGALKGLFVRSSSRRPGVEVYYLWESIISEEFFDNESVLTSPQEVRKFQRADILTAGLSSNTSIDFSWIIL